MVRAACVCLLWVLVPIGGVLAQEPAPAVPQPMVDPLRPARVAQRDAWGKLAERLFERPEATSKLQAAWALFHQFDVDYFSLAEADPDVLLDDYERRVQAWRRQLAEADDESEPLIRLTLAELSALQDDLRANRLQNARPEGVGNDSPELKAWNARFEDFQTERVRTLQDRGRRTVSLYREGAIDAVRLCVALLERQIAERVLLEHQEMSAVPGAGEKFAAQRTTLLKKQRDEWKRLGELLPESKAKQAAIGHGERICALHIQTLDLLEARQQLDAGPAVDESDPRAEEAAALARRVFQAYQDLHRAAVTDYFETRLTVEQLARVHDLRMYTTIWSNAAVPPADVVADIFEVAEAWRRVVDSLAKAAPSSLDLAIAQAKRQEAEIARDERQPPTAK